MDLSFLFNSIRELPFANVSSIDSSYSSTNCDQSFGEERELDETWANYDKMAQVYSANAKIGHINANSIAGLKFHEIKSWLLAGRFDILIISETKLDATFPNSQFPIQVFRMCRADRDIHSGGLMGFFGQ